MAIFMDTLTGVSYITALNVGSTSGPMIDNTGKIELELIGIYSAVGAGLKTTIVNGHGGVIKGGQIDTNGGAAISHDGKLQLTNDGKIKGDIVSGGGPDNDKIVNKGTIKGEVFFGPGDDTYKSKGGKAGPLHGHEGNDTFILGSKAETIVFDTALSALTNVDRIKKFESGKDGFHLRVDIFTSLSLGALTSSNSTRARARRTPTTTSSTTRAPARSTTTWMAAAALRRFSSPSLIPRQPPRIRLPRHRLRAGNNNLPPRRLVRGGGIKAVGSGTPQGPGPGVDVQPAERPDPQSCL